MPPVTPFTPAFAGSPANRRAGAAALAGVGVGVTLIWGSLTALDRFVLGFHAWPEGPQVAAQRLVVEDVPKPITGQQRLSAARLLGGPGVLGAGLRLVPGSAPGTLVLGGAGPAVARGPGAASGGGLTAPGVAGGVQGPSAGTISKTDPDGDGIPTAVEQQLGTNPTSSDSDGDGTPDGVEQSSGANPLNSADGGLAPASPDSGTPQAFGPGTGTPDGGKDPAGAVGDPAVAEGGDGADTPPVATPPDTPPAADPGDQPGLGTTPGDPAAPVDPPVASDPAPAPDPVPSPDPVPTVDPVTAPTSPIDPSPADAPAPPEPETGGVGAPAEAPAPAPAT